MASLTSLPVKFSHSYPSVGGTRSSDNGRILNFLILILELGGLGKTIRHLMLSPALAAPTPPFE